MNAPIDSPATATIESGFQLGVLRIDPRAGEVVGPGGREKLDHRVMEVFVMLAQSAGHPVPREELLARLWPNVVVTDEVLSRCIYELRRQLSQAGGSERYREMIETLPKRGYRLVGEVILNPPQPAVRPGGRSWRRYLGVATAIGVATLVAVLIGQRLTLSPENARSPDTSIKPNSIAVLPFVDMSIGKDQGYFSDGISEEILNRLAQAENLRVISRTSSFSFRDKPLDVAEIARRLNVTHVLEGSVRKSGDRIRITVQLIAASDNSHVWSDTFDRGLGDVFAVQDEIAASVARALEITLVGRAPESQPPSNVEAYQHFLEGEFFYWRQAPGDPERSVRAYEEAVSMDPGYARAWASLAGAYSMRAWEKHPPDRTLMSKQGQAALKAIELDPNLAIAHTSLAVFYWGTGDREKAYEHHRKAALLDPNNPTVLENAIEAAVDRGNLAAAIAMQRGIVARDPLAAAIRNNLAVFLLADGQLEEALSQFRRVQQIHPQAAQDVTIDIVHILILQRRYDEARSMLDHVPEGKLRDSGLALLYAATDRTTEADVTVSRLEGPPGDIMDTVRLAEVYAFRGMNDQALDLLHGRKTTLEREHGVGSGHVWYLQYESRLSPFLKTLHADVRWVAFVAGSDGH